MRKTKKIGGFPVEAIPHVRQGRVEWSAWLIDLPFVYARRPTLDEARQALAVEQACAGPQYARRDVQVALAPSVSAQLMISPLRYEMPRPSCGRDVRFPGAQESRPQ